ncbi:MAG TPA: LiaF domain-containing protein [Ktedonobacterales bacterium]|jgi:hypothetical protein
MQQQPALTPQQQAIQEVRRRYEHGEFSFDRFEYALGALMQAQTPEQCQAILDELPVSSVPATQVAFVPVISQQPRVQRSRWMVAIMGGVNRMRRPWRMGQSTQAIAIMGGMELDLSLAAIPADGVFRIFTVMGGLKLYVPSSVEVTVRGAIALGGVSVCGEGHGGIISFFDEEVPPAGITPDMPAHLEIQIVGLMGGVEIVQVDAPVVMGGKPVGPQSSQSMAQFEREQRRLLREQRQAERHAEREMRRQRGY